jgi:hypothetical protein
LPGQAGASDRERDGERNHGDRRRIESGIRKCTFRIGSLESRRHHGGMARDHL